MLYLDSQEITRQIANKKKLSKEKKAGIKETIEWINSNTICLPKPSKDNSYNQKVLAAIDRTITETFGMDLKKVYSPSRKRDCVIMRARAMSTYQTLTGSSEQETADAFKGLRSRITFHHLKKLVEDLGEIYPGEKAITESFQQSVIKILKEK